MLFNWILYLSRIADSQWLWAVFLKIHTWIHNFNQYNGYYKYWNNNTIYTRQDNTHIYRDTHTLNNKQIKKICLTMI